MYFRKKRIDIAFVLVSLLVQTTICYSQTSIPDNMEAQTPARTILFVIDGLHYEAPQHLSMTNFLAVAEAGVYIEKAWLLMPYHPVTGPWDERFGCSMPNPIMLGGSLFIPDTHRLVQEMFPSNRTAHVANSGAYRAVDRGSHFSVIANTNDEFTVETALNILRNEEIQYMRIHLQDTGTGGYYCYIEKGDVPWKYNIWGEGSPYVENAKHADVLLGQFVQGLKDMGKWEDTLFVLTSDHGQAACGWHPLLPEESWVTPLVFHGPGIRSGFTYTDAEHTDIIPTICHVMGVPVPNDNPGKGRVLYEVMTGAEPDRLLTDDQNVTREINLSLKQQMLLHAHLMLQAEKHPWVENRLLLTHRRLYHLDRFLEWPKAGTLDKLLKANMDVVEELQNVKARVSGQ